MRKHLKSLTISLIILSLLVPVIIAYSVLTFDPFIKGGYSILDYTMGIGIVSVLSLIFAVMSIRIKKTFLGVVVILFNLMLLGVISYILINYRH